MGLRIHGHLNGTNCEDAMASSLNKMATATVPPGI